MKIEKFWRLRNENVEKQKMKNANENAYYEITTVRSAGFARAALRFVYKMNLLLLLTCDAIRMLPCTLYTLHSVGMMLVIKFMKTEDMRTGVCASVCMELN